jgi:hypothetical protein
MRRVVPGLTPRGADHACATGWSAEPVTTDQSDVAQHVYLLAIHKDETLCL